MQNLVKFSLIVLNIQANVVELNPNLESVKANIKA